MERGKSCGTVFFDLSKAFDTVDHTILLRKLSSFGVTSNTAKWFESYLNPLKPNSDLSQASHCHIKGLSVSEVIRIQNMITQVKFY